MEVWDNILGMHTSQSYLSYHQRSKPWEYHIQDITNWYKNTSHRLSRESTQKQGSVSPLIYLVVRKFTHKNASIFMVFHIRMIRWYIRLSTHYWYGFVAVHLFPTHKACYCCIGKVCPLECPLWNHHKDQHGIYFPLSLTSLRRPAACSNIMVGEVPTPKSGYKEFRIRHYILLRFI